MLGCTSGSRPEVQQLTRRRGSQLGFVIDSDSHTNMLISFALTVDHSSGGLLKSKSYSRFFLVYLHLFSPYMKKAGVTPLA